MTTPSDISGAEFRRALRGYDPDEVRAFLTDLAQQVESLQRQHAVATRRLAEYGERDRDQQIDQLTADINRILHEAQAAAENLKNRAEAETSALRAQTQQHVAEVLAGAEADAYALRRDAWEAGAKLLEDVAAYVAATRKQADAEALEIIGEAERTTHRKLATARRDAENQLRAARLEGERIRVEAQAERDELLENARRAAESAQERTRALERRREELLVDIERLQLDGTPNSPTEPASTTVRVLRPGTEDAGRSEADNDSVRIVKPSEPSDWKPDTDSVRLVEPPAKPAAEFLDGERLADEVRKLRETEPAPPAQGGTEERLAPEPPAVAQPSAPVGDAAGESPPKPAATVPDPAGTAAPAGEGEGQSAAAPPVDPTAEAEPAATEEATEHKGVPAEGRPSPAVEEAAAEAAAEAVEEAVEEEAPTAEIDQLFSQLRGGTVVGPPRRPKVAIIPADQINPASVGTEVSEDTSVDELMPPAPVDPAEVRDRLLLPITNRVLRSIKRQLSEAQNIALEGLRLDPEGWAPDPEAFEQAVTPDLGLLQNEAFAAGGAAAGELLGEAPPRPRFPGVDATVAAGFAGRIHRQVTDGLAAGREAGQGARELSATASRVYRAWRSDQAERVIRGLATQVFHRGMQAAYQGAGVEKLRLVISGAGCVDCRAAAEHLVDTADGRLALPPLHEECSCTLVHT